MTERHQYASDYQSDHLALVRATCLTIASYLGDLLNDLVLIGGIVPSFLIPQENLPPDMDHHAGTQDLDIAFSLGILENERYTEITERLRNAGFEPDRNPNGNLTLQRWIWKELPQVKIDFLIPPADPADIGGTIKHLEGDFGAIISPGVHLAFRDRIEISLTGKTLAGEECTREMGVCGPGAFTILKALAFDGRGKNKDAYDLFYVVRNYQAGPGDVADRLIPLLNNDYCQQGLEILKRDFSSPDALGPVRVANFLFSRTEENTQADVAGFIKRLLQMCDS